MLRRIALLLVVIGLSFGVSITIARANPSAVSLDRSTVDRSDDLWGPQVHLVYATSSDGPNRGLDVNGTIATSWGLVNSGWFASQTGGPILRTDLYQGEPDITFVRLPQPDAEVAPDPVHWIYLDLQTLGLSSPDKIYLVYYDGAGGRSCGLGVGESGVGVEMLHGQSPGAPPCDSSSLASPGASVAGYTDFGGIHEAVHAIPPGFVARCAPHFTSVGGAHVPEPNDLMYSGGNGPWQYATGLALDVGHDDYYRPQEAETPGECPNLAHSDYLTNHPFYPVRISARGGGTVIAAVGDQLKGCDSPGPCTFVYRQGSTVKLSVTANPGYHFTGWSGGGCTGTGDCAVTVNADTSVTATFVPDPVLTIKVSGPGSVKIPTLGKVCAKPVCKFSVPYRQATTALVTLKPNSFFTGWSGVCTGGKPCRLNLSSDSSLRAWFVPTFTLKLGTSGQGSFLAGYSFTTKIPNGGIGAAEAAKCSSAQCRPFKGVPFGSTVSASQPTPAKGWVFTGWSGGSCRGKGTCTFKLAHNAQVVAKFAKTTKK